MHGEWLLVRNGKLGRRLAQERGVRDRGMTQTRWMRTKRKLRWKPRVGYWPPQILPNTFGGAGLCGLKWDWRAERREKTGSLLPSSGNCRSHRWFPRAACSLALSPSQVTSLPKPPG